MLDRQAANRLAQRSYATAAKFVSRRSIECNSEFLPFQLLVVVKSAYHYLSHPTLQVVVSSEGATNAYPLVGLIPHLLHPPRQTDSSALVGDLRAKRSRGSGPGQGHVLSPTP